MNINVRPLSPAEVGAEIRQKYLLSGTVRMTGNTQTEYSAILNKYRIVCHIFISEMWRQRRSLYLPFKYGGYQIRLRNEKWDDL